MNKLVALALACILGAAPALAGDARKDSIEIKGAWARASAGPMMRAGGAFMTLTNHGTSPDRLIGAATGVSKLAELHTHIKDGDVMRMRAVEAIDLPAGKTVELAPGGLHVMLMELEKPLEQGTAFSLVLKFEKAGEIALDVDVQSAGAMGPMGAHGHMMHGSPKQ